MFQLFYSLEYFIKLFLFHKTHVVFHCLFQISTHETKWKEFLYTCNPRCFSLFAPNLAHETKWKEFYTLVTHVVFHCLLQISTHETKMARVFIHLWQCVRVQKQNIWGQSLTTTQKKSWFFFKGFNMIKVFTLVIKQCSPRFKACNMKNTWFFLKLHQHFN